MRLLDKLLTRRIAHEHELHLPTVMQLLNDSQLVVADNVSEYYAKTRLTVDPEASDFPNVMLPFDLTFVDMKAYGYRELGSIDELGVLLKMTEPQSTPPSFLTKHPELVAPEVKAHLVAVCFLGYKDGTLDMPVTTFLPVGEDYRVIDNSDKAGMRFYFKPNRTFPGLSEDVAYNFCLSVLSAAMPRALLTISLMHCRNVKVLTEIPPPKLSKKHEKKSGRPLIKYRVLQIDHMKQVLEREGHASTEGLKKALHICRGHFKHYGRDGKGLLFGKHTATVWVPMHTRGDLEEGVVVKDYNVK